jgi:hypothetical protein
MALSQTLLNALEWIPQLAWNIISHVLNLTVFVRMATKVPLSLRLDTT